MARTLIFSDTHLTPKMEPEKFIFLHNLINRADEVIILGDFWDSLWWGLADFVHSPWRELFLPMLNRPTTYLYGNHDPYQDRSELYQHFCTQHAESLDFMIKDVHYHLEHGHRLQPTLDDQLPWFPRYPLRLGAFLEGTNVHFKGERYFKEAYTSNNEVIKKRYRRLHGPDTFLITGHSHLATLEPSNRYANTGLIRWGYAQYLLLENGKLSLHRERYNSSEKPSVSSRYSSRKKRSPLQ